MINRHSHFGSSSEMRSNAHVENPSGSFWDYYGFRLLWL